MSDYINLNTLFIIVIALAVVVLIMLITYFVSIKPSLNTTTESKDYNSSSVDQVVSPIVQEENLVSDCELVAVITAAIYASMGDAVPAGGLVVRSIRRSNPSAWKNA